MINLNRFSQSRKAASQWISWVLLVALSVVIGIFIFQWARGLTLDHSDELKERADYAQKCQDLGIRVTGICQNSQTLNINVTNNNNLKIERVIVNMLDIYDNPQLREINVTIRPEESKQLKIVKQGIVKKADIIPAVLRGRTPIVCQSKEVSTETIPIC